MRILFVTRKFPPSVGGMEVFSEELFLALERKCGNGGVMLFKPDPPIIGRPGVFALLRFFIKASTAVLRDARDVDVVLLGDAVLTPLSWLAKLCTRGSVATVVTAHGNDVYYARRRKASSIVYRTSLKLFARSADLLVANSADTRRAAAALGFRRTVRIPLATRQIPPGPEAVPPSNSILFAGRLMRCKGLAWFIAEVMPKLDPHVALLVAGPPWDQAEMDAVSDCPQARYLGSLPRDSLPQLRTEVFACIMPNLPAHLSGQNEGFGLSALESSAVGTPVVASNLGGLAEAVVDGITGFLVEPLDASGFAARINAISKWNGQERQEFATRARQTVAERFTWDRVAEDYLAEFERLAPCRAPAPN